MKNLKTLIPALICAVAFFASCNNAPKEEATTTSVDSTAIETSYTVNADSNSRVIWKGVMLGVKEHTGKVSIKEGNLTVKGGQLVKGNFIVDLSTIAPLDTNYNEKAGYGKSKLIGHLSSADFFDVANFPTASFVIKSVTGNSATGTLTVRGKSNEETLSNIVINENNGTLKASGQLKFDRKKYDVKFDMAMKDMVISNDVELNIELTGKK
jgi:polyisoprenoid-binding protein YceI